MARTKTINFQRVTLSFPKKTLDALRQNLGITNMSKYIADLVEKDLKQNEDETVEEFMADLDKLAKENAKNRVDKRPSLEILRELRYERKY